MMLEGEESLPALSLTAEQSQSICGGLLPVHTMLQPELISSLPWIKWGRANLFGSGFY